ncbi:GntR family transcriptional regulator [uncultured Corynebacterium sp.]|uniref:GntR family transcriptional regulator n=1 Tax=uncultured Corynebacterium sp. TaxID=159447 RepID=UPI0025D0658B|nr:GntR family transcriptional regulator [uncultured Corynebacterium sp.]
MRSTEVTSDIRRAIASGRFTPGEKLNELALAKQLEVSRNTLRESFATLCAQGLLERIPNRGVFIAAPTLEDARDYYTARAHMEPAALLWGEHLDVDELETYVSQAERCLRIGDDFGVATEMQNFHRAIIRASGSEQLDELMDEILAKMRLSIIEISKTKDEFQAPYISEYRKIVDLLRGDQRSNAAELLRDTIVRTRDCLNESYTSDFQLRA